MKEKLAPESPLEYMMSAVFGIEVTDAQMKEQWEARQVEAKRIAEWLETDNKRLAKLREVVGG